MKFEDNLKRLEALVTKMESGELSLDDMIKSFEEGRRLVKTCQDDLASIRQRIEKVTQSGATEPLEV
ncbi:MAG: exodeoxyribonuclease VII small subunit [Kiritimatiellae bacterium]|nr:exodeoxyribonuclease VII small subunit [Kiritimatiellia bacterium]